MNDKLRKLLLENPQMFLQIYTKHYNNRVGLLKDNFNLSDNEIKILDNEYFYTHFNGIKNKKRVKRVKKHIDFLTSKNIHVDKDNMNVAVPYDCVFDNDIEKSLNKLKEYGYTIGKSTISTLF